MQVNFNRHQLRKSPRGVSLLELIAVMTLLGIVATVSVASYRRGTLGNVSAKTDAFRIAAELRLARQKAIASGENHLLAFSRSGGLYTYTMCKRGSGGLTAVSQAYTFHKDVTINSTPSNPEFNFEGDGLSSYTVTVSGPDRIFDIRVNQVTGAPRVTERPR